MTKNQTSVFNIHNMAKIAILGAIAVVLMMIEVPLPFLAPPFYKLDLSELAVLVGGFAMGPVAAIIIEALKIVINTLFTGTSTAYIGELANFLMGCAYAVPAALYYQTHKTKKGAMQSLVLGSLFMCIIAPLLNYLVLIPAYSTFYGLAEETIVGMGHAIFPVVQNRLTFVLVCVLPFNLAKTIIVSLLTLLIYKHVSPLLHSK